MWLCNHLCNANLMPAEWLQIYYSELQITICWAKLLHLTSYGSEEEMQQEQMGKSSSTSPETTQGVYTAHCGGFHRLRGRVRRQ